MATIFCVSCETETGTLSTADDIFSNISHFEYNNHKYIYFSSYRSRAGVVHDPDCQCNTTNLIKRYQQGNYAIEVTIDGDKVDTLYIFK